MAASNRAIKSCGAEARRFVQALGSRPRMSSRSKDRGAKRSGSKPRPKQTWQELRVHARGALMNGTVSEVPRRWRSDAGDYDLEKRYRCKPGQRSDVSQSPQLPFSSDIATHILAR